MAIKEVQTLRTSSSIHDQYEFRRLHHPELNYAKTILDSRRPSAAMDGVDLEDGIHTVIVNGICDYIIMNAS